MRRIFIRYLPSPLVMKKPAIIIADDTVQLNKIICDDILSLGRQAVRDQDFFSVALSGGRSPRALLHELTLHADNPLWQKAHIFQVDERFISPDHPDNNFRMIQESFLDHVPVPREQCYAMVERDLSLHEAARKYASRMRAFFSNQTLQYPAFDLILLGVGGDGHTASLFPGETAGTDTTDWVVPVETEHAGYQRISLTLPLMNQARHIFFLVTGQDKAAIMEEVLAGESHLPAARVHAPHGSLHFYLDREAARSLS